ncbi:MAG: tetratricopeptide repeat protein, partial [Gammaproteobacteria bacterium]|nr:tetratricopeptide repeat protein [Gammaproteobacteria bacterium]
QSTWKPTAVSKENIETNYPGEYMSVLKIGTQTKIRRYRQAIENNPDDINAHLQIGIILAKAGDRKESMKYFDKIIKADPKNAAALNNRGNLLFIDEDLKGAAKAYVAATQVDANDAYLWVNLAKTYKLMKQVDKAKDAFIKATKLDSSIKKKYRVMSLELLNTL